MRAACVQCRVRKVRCDGTTPCCKTCHRLRFNCSFQQSGSGGGYAPQLPPKRRGAEACLECRNMKVRCSRDTPRCSNCHKRNRQCTYASTQGASTSTLGDTMVGDERFETSPYQSSSLTSEVASAISVTSESIVASPPSTLACASPTADEVTRLIAKYFDCLFPLPSFCFLHKDTVVQRCRDGSIDQSLKLAIGAIVSMFLDQHRNQRMVWAQESEKLILDRLDKPSIFLIQASLLLIRFRAAVGQFPRAFILAGLAARWAVALRLNYEHSGLGLIAQEVRRRTLWSLYLLEDIFCVGLKEFELLDPEIVYLQLPCEDDTFSQRRPSSTGFLQSGRGIEPEILGSRAAFIKLTLIRRSIMRFNRKICAREITQSELFASIERLQNDLLRLRTRLAPGDQYPRNSPEELQWGPQYALLHMSWHQCHCDLYRIFLTGYPEVGPHAMLEGMSGSERELMKDKCLGHAEQIVRVLSDFVHHKEEQHLLEHDAAVCAYHAARLILFGTYDASHESDFPMQMAANKAQLCLDVITRYFSFSAQLESMRVALGQAIKQHKRWWKPTNQADVPATDTAQTPPNVSKDAHIRQKLAIHSLLRQSDFIDDSREAALEPQTESALEVATSVTANPATNTPQEPRMTWSVQDNIPSSWNFLLNDPTNAFYGPSFGMGFDFNGAMSQGSNEFGDLIGGIEEQGMY